MSKKKHPTNERKSARGHQENSAIRWREELKKERYRIGKDGKRIIQSPVNTFDKDWLAGHLNSPEVSGPPVIDAAPPPPDNVTSISKARKAKESKAVSQSGNEAEVVKPVVNSKLNYKKSKPVPQGFLHNKAMAIDEFRGWARVHNEIGIKRCGSELWTKTEKGKLSSPSLEAQRERSKRGHMKAKVKGPASTTHNPLLKEPESGGYAPPDGSKPLDPKFYMPPRQGGSQGKTPSGQLIRGFTPTETNETSVVYTAENAPPTPSRDWRAKVDEKLNNSVQVRKTPGIMSDYMRLTGQIRWYVDNVDVQKWPMPMYRFVKWTPDGYKLQYDVIEQVSKDRDAELNVMKAMLHGMQRQYRMIDIALLDATSENNLLRQELAITKQELEAEKQDRLTFEYQLAQQTGDPVSAEEIRQDIVELTIGKPKLPPEDADEMVRHFRLFRSFEAFHGPEHAFARFVYGDPALGQVIRDQADMRFNERQKFAEEQEEERKEKLLRDHVINTMQAEWEQEKHDNYVSFWEKQYPVYVKQRARRSISAVRPPERESVALAAIARKGKPAAHRSSTYYSSPEHSYHTNKRNAVVDVILADVRPTKVRYNNPRCVEHDTRESWATPTKRGINTYEKWWAERLDWCEVHYLEIKHPVRVALVKGYNKAVDILNTSVDPASRRKEEKQRERIRQHMQERAERREQRREEREQAKKAKAEREHIRKMQRIAH